MSKELVQSLQEGNVVILATDTVAALAACPGSKGYADIFAMKQRPADQALPWLVGSVAALDELACDVPEYARRLAQMFWPGPLTLVLNASRRAAGMGELSADGTIALRCPDAPHLLDLIEEISCPLCATSANLHGRPVATCYEELPAPMRQLAGAHELEGFQADGRASTIVDCTGAFPHVLREGPIPNQVLLDVACFGATLESCYEDAWSHGHHG